MEDQKKVFIDERINNLPKGCVTKRNINGKIYFYYQWVEDGKQYSKVISEERAKELSAQILQRRQLIKEQKNSISRTNPYIEHSPSFTNVKKENYYTNVITGDNILNFCLNESKLNEVDVCNNIREYLSEENNQKLFILYGIKGSGKTTILKQVISSLPSNEINKSVFIQLSPFDDYNKLDSDLIKLTNSGFKYFFIDEITLLNDFYYKPYFLFNNYSSKGYKIILSGTDSLRFALNGDNEFLSKCELVDITFIPYKAARDIYGVKDVLEYIKSFKCSGYGASIDSNLYSDSNLISEYISKAVLSNMQKALDYTEGELELDLNKTLSNLNYKYALSLISNCFADTNIQKYEHLKQLNEFILIKTKETNLNILDSKKIIDLLSMMHFIVDVDIVNLVDLNHPAKKLIFTQFSLRYYMLLKCIKDLLLSDRFKGISIDDRNILISSFEKAIIKGLVQDLILLETKMFSVDFDVFTLKFGDGEYNMVVHNKKTTKCSIYKIIADSKVEPPDLKDLLDQKKLHDTEFRYGKIDGKYILYLGDAQSINGIECVNINDYLSDVSLSQDERKIIAEFKKVLSKLTNKQK